MTRRSPSKSASARKSQRGPNLRNPSRGDPAATNSLRRGPEPRAVEWMTVAWALAGMVTLTASLFGTMGLIMMGPAGAAEPTPGRLLLTLMIVTAVVAGCLLLALTPLVHRLRIEKPPLSLEVGACIAGLYPWSLVLIHGM